MTQILKQIHNILEEIKHLKKKQRASTHKNRILRYKSFYKVKVLIVFTSGKPVLTLTSGRNRIFKNIELKYLHLLPFPVH